MKKGKILVLGVIAMVLIGGLVLASCGLNDCDAGSCGKILANCRNDTEVACNGLIGGNTSCARACK
jgi:hypothetical protein